MVWRDLSIHWLVIPFSFLPQKLDRMDLPGALLDTGIMVSVTLLQ